MSVTTEITVVGMTCQHCVTAITEEVSALPGVTSVSVDLESGRVQISSAAALDTDSLGAAVAEAGYSMG